MGEWDVAACFRCGNALALCVSAEPQECSSCILDDRGNAACVEPLIDVRMVRQRDGSWCASVDGVRVAGASRPSLLLSRVADYLTGGTYAAKR